MFLSLDDSRNKLINGILFAGSQEQVKNIIDAAMLLFETNKVHGHIVLRFVEKIIMELELFSPMKNDAQQWSNITVSKVLFKRVKHQLTVTAS